MASGEPPVGKEQYSLPALEAEATGIKRITRLGAVHSPDINSIDPAEKNSVLWPWQTSGRPWV